MGEFLTEKLAAGRVFFYDAYRNLHGQEFFGQIESDRTSANNHAVADLVGFQADGLEEISRVLRRGDDGNQISVL